MLCLTYISAAQGVRLSTPSLAMEEFPDSKHVELPLTSHAHHRHHHSLAKNSLKKLVNKTYLSHMSICRNDRKAVGNQYPELMK